MGILIEFSMGGLVLESGPLLVCVRYFKSKIVHCVMYITITEKSIINLKMKIIENFNEIYATKHGTIFAGGNAVVVFKTSVC